LSEGKINRALLRNFGAIRTCSASTSFGLLKTFGYRSPSMIALPSVNAFRDFSVVLVNINLHFAVLEMTAGDTSPVSHAFSQKSSRGFGQ
jgi:hypothetical protein